MEITVNGEKKTFDRQMSLLEVLGELEVDPLRVVIERNKEIVPRPEYEKTQVADNDKLEILHFVGGG